MKQRYTLIFSFLLSFISLFAQAPTNLQATPYRTTVHLSWDEDVVFPLVGYNIYRSENSQDYGPPARTIGAYEDYTDYNLDPATTYYYKIAAFDKDGVESPHSQEVMVSTNNNEYLKVASLDLLIPVYDGDMWPTAPDEIWQGLAFARSFYFRNTGAQLNLNYHFMQIEGHPPPRPEDYLANFETIGADLTERGILDNQYDAIHVCAHNLYGWRGGALWLGQTAGSMAYNWTGFDPDNHYSRGDAWVFTHEFGHSLDLIIARLSGYPEMVFNHFAHAHPMIPEIGVFDSGENFDGMALVLRLFEHHLDYQAPWDGYIEVVDSDQDGLPDNDPRLAGDELRFGSNPNVPDSDGDGLDDLGEFIADNYQGADPNNPDTDGDGSQDAEDIYPVSNMKSTMQKSTAPINIDGNLDNAEAWQPMGSGTYYSKLPGASLAAYATWDDDYLYFAFQSDQYLKYHLLIDGNGEDGIFASDVRWTEGDYSTFDGTSYGISYFDQASLLVLANEDEVYKRESPINGSMVFTEYDNGIYTTEVKLPHNLGPGFGYTYTPPNAPVLSELFFGEGDIIGLQLIAHPLAAANGYEWSDWRTRDWMSLAQPFHYYDVELVAGLSNEYCTSSSNFPWEDWISHVQIGSINNASGKSPYSDFSDESTTLMIGTSTSISLTTSYSYFTWDEYWRVWIDLNQDMDFDDPGELKFEGILSAPPPGTTSKTLNTNLFIAPGTLEGSTRMRVAMRREGYADPCETLDFGEVEDYSVELIPIPELPDLVLPNNEVIPGGNFLCYTDPGDNFGYLGGVILNAGPGAAGPYEVSVFISEDDQLSEDDLEWYNESYDGLDPTGTGNYTDGYAATLDLPADLTPGVYYFIGKIDPEDAVEEINENNNTFMVYQQVGAPDFAISNTSGVPTQAFAGDPVNFSVEVENLSPFPLAELNTDVLTIEVYLSTDDVFQLGVDELIGETNLALSQFSNPPFYEGGTAILDVEGFLPPGLSTGNYYLFARAKFNCDQVLINNSSDPQLIFIDTEGPTNEYCMAEGNFPWQDWISNVTIGDFQHASGKSKYSDFTDQVIPLETSSLFSVSLTSAYSYFTWDEYWRIWIDYNKDNDFNDPGELVFSRVLNAPPNGTPSADLLGSFWISSSMPEGTTRMRIRMSRDGFAGPCGDTPFGEVEDYTVQIGPNSTCEIAATVGNIVCQDNGTPNDPNDDTFTFEVLVTGTGVGSTWQMTWPMEWGILGYATGNYDVPELIGPLQIADYPVDYPVGISYTIRDYINPNCIESGTVMPPPPCSQTATEYCNSSSEFPWHEWIGEVSLHTLTQLSGKSVYSDFTDVSTTLVKGGTYPIDLTAHFSYSTWDEYWNVWIDFNQDNDFNDAGELVFSEVMPAPGNGTPEWSISGSVSVPAGAATGATRMRVSMQRGSSADPCTILPFGEVEDYSIQILGNTSAGMIGAIDFSAILNESRVSLEGQFVDYGPTRVMGVERSENGADFIVIETMLSERDNLEKQFLATEDVSPVHGFNYYRIWLELENGDRLYSPVRQVQFVPPEACWIYPNPAKTEIAVAFERPAAEGDQWTIYDTFGKVVWRKPTNETPVSPMSIEVSSFRPGMYFLSIYTEDRPVVNRKFLIVRD